MKKILLYLVLLMAVTMAAIVAYVSVNGLLKVFSGAGTLGLLLFSSIEIAKIVATSAIHTYNKKIGLFYSICLSLGILISMIITSVGIYGFLSTSYQESFNSMIVTENKIELIEGKSKLLIENKVNLNEDIKLKRSRINKILEVRSQQEVRLDSLYNKRWYSSAKKTEKIISDANNDIKIIENEINGLSNKLGVINDSINSNSLKVIELNQNNEGASELNSLKYLSTVTGKSMDEVMKWFILLLIVIGDPMAVLMVIVFNKIVNKGDIDDESNGDEPNNPTPPNTDKVFVSPGVYANEPKLHYSVDNAPTPELEVTDDKIKLKNPVIIETPKVIESEPVKPTITDSDAANDAVKFKDKSNKVKKIVRGDIREIKERERGFSVKIPNRDENSGNVNRVGTNKITKGDDPNNLIFKKGSNENK
tara:strand:+ start:3762 stop:5024 length:1263 start_codon:yes stop_codon:yes gene_type:complete